MVEAAAKALATEFGTGAVIGFVSGFAAKKVTKLIAVVIGGGLLLAKWMETQGMVSINWTGVGSGFAQAGSAAAETAPSVLDAIVSTLGLGGGFVGGFYLGFRRG